MLVPAEKSKTSVSDAMGVPLARRFEILAKIEKRPMQNTRHGFFIIFL